MGRRKLGDRAWHRWNASEGRWEIVTVRGGRRTCVLCPDGTTEAGAERAAEIIRSDLDTGALSAPDTWAEAVTMFIEAAKTGAHRPHAKKRRPTRDKTRATYESRLKAAGRTLSRMLGDRFDPLTLSTDDGVRFIDARRRELAAPPKPGKPPRYVSDATVKDDIEAVTIMQRWMLGRKWITAATWEQVARPDVVSSRAPLRPDEVGAFLRAAVRLGKDPAAATGRPSTKRHDWELWPAAVWLFMHGLRSGEAGHLIVGDVDCTTGFVHVADREGARTKSSASIRTFPILSEEGLEVLRDTLRGRPLDERIFDTGARRGAVSDRPERWFLYRCKITCQVAGIRECTVHELRHTVATAAVAAGADMESVRALLGHEDTATTRKVYSHAQAGVLARAAAREVGSFLDRVYRARPALRKV